MIYLIAALPFILQSTERVSVSSAGVQGNGPSGSASISYDGNIVAFESLATNLVPNDTNGYWDAFVRNRATGITRRVSLDYTGAESPTGGRFPLLSADGRYVAFHGSGLTPGGGGGVYIFDRSTGVVTHASQDGLMYFMLVDFSPNGGALALYGPEGLYVRDLLTGTTERIHVNSDAQGGVAALSFEGRVVVFWCYPIGQVHSSEQPINGLFVYDRRLHLVTPLTTIDNHRHYSPSISWNGRFVAFTSGSTAIVPSDTTFYHHDVFVHDRVNGTTRIVSVSSSGEQGNMGGGSPSISASGRFIAFASDSTNLTSSPDLDRTDIFIHDQVAHTTQQISVTMSGAPTTEFSERPSISGNGRVVAFESLGAEFVLGDTNWSHDVFVREW